jgi:hypothetical protein
MVSAVELFELSEVACEFQPLWGSVTVGKVPPAKPGQDLPVRLPGLHPELGINGDPGTGLSFAESAHIGEEEEAARTSFPPCIAAQLPVLASTAQRCPKNGPRNPD